MGSDPGSCPPALAEETPGVHAFKCCRPSPGSDRHQRRYQVLTLQPCHRICHSLIVILCLSVWHRLQIPNLWVRALWGRILGIMANTILFANPADCHSSGSWGPNKQIRAKNKCFLPTAASPEEGRLHVWIRKHCPFRPKPTEFL